MVGQLNELSNVNTIIDSITAESYGINDTKMDSISCGEAIPDFGSWLSCKEVA